MERNYYESKLENSNLDIGSLEQNQGNPKTMVRNSLARGAGPVEEVGEDSRRSEKV